MLLHHLSNQADPELSALMGTIPSHEDYAVSTEIKLLEVSTCHFDILKSNFKTFLCINFSMTHIIFASRVKASRLLTHIASSTRRFCSLDLSVRKWIPNSFHTSQIGLKKTTQLSNILMLSVYNITTTLSSDSSLK